MTTHTPPPHLLDAIIDGSEAQPLTATVRKDGSDE